MATEKNRGWYESAEYPVNIQTILDQPDSNILNEGLPLFIENESVTDYFRVGTCYESVTGTEVKFYKDHTLSVGDTINGVLISDINTSNADYDVITVASANFVVGTNYSVTPTSLFNAISYNDTDLTKVSSVLVKKGGFIRTNYIPNKWHAAVTNVLLSSNFIDGNPTSTAFEKGYKEYMAILSQSGTNPPTAIELKNDFNSDVEFLYVNTGAYQIKIEGELTLGKTTTSFGAPNWDGLEGFILSGQDGDADWTYIMTKDIGGNSQNGMLVDVLIHIIVKN